MASDASRGEDLVEKSAQKVTLSPSQDIPFDKLVLSKSNARCGVAAESERPAGSGG